MQKIVKAHNLDPALDSLFVDSQNFVVRYGRFLQQRQSIIQHRSDQTGGDLLAGLFKGLDTGSKSADMASALGASKSASQDAQAVGGVVGLVSDYTNRSDQHDAEQNAAIQREMDGLVSDWQQTVGRAQQTARTMAQRHGWSFEETGYDGFRSSNLLDYVRRMPRNAFAVLEAASFVTGSETASVLVDRAKACLAAQELVPGGDTYDLLRSVFAFKAADLAVSAAAVETGLQGYAGQVTPTRGFAEYLARKYISENPSFAGAQGDILLARGLALTGRFQEAVRTDLRAFKKDSEALDGIAALRHAQMLSMEGDQGGAIEWIVSAYARGFNDPREVRNVGGFHQLKLTRPSDFERLTTAILSNPVPIWGFITDDFEVKNLSPFDLTNVIVSAVVHKGGNTYPFKMKCPVIRASATCRANGVVSIPGSSMDYIEASFSSDQTTN